LLVSRVRSSDSAARSACSATFSLRIRSTSSPDGPTLLRTICSRNHVHDSISTPLSLFEASAQYPAAAGGPARLTASHSIDVASEPLPWKENRGAAVVPRGVLRVWVMAHACKPKMHGKDKPNKGAASPNNGAADPNNGTVCAHFLNSAITASMRSASATRSDTCTRHRRASECTRLTSAPGLGHICGRHRRRPDVPPGGSIGAAASQPVRGRRKAYSAAAAQSYRGRYDRGMVAVCHKDQLQPAVRIPTPAAVLWDTLSRTGDEWSGASQGRSPGARLRHYVHRVAP
jgi:hypothetical protein